MLKRMCAVIFTLFSVLSIGYAYYNIEMKAASVTYHAGGNVTGRIHIPPSGLSNSEYGLRKGDKIVVGLDNPKDTSDLGLMLIHYDENYTDYRLNLSDMTNPILPDSPISGWFVMSTSSIANVVPVNSNSQFDTISEDGYLYVKYSNSNIKTKINGFNANVVGTKIENLILPRDYEDYKIIWNVRCRVSPHISCTSSGESVVKNALEDNGYFFLYLDSDRYIRLASTTNSSYTSNIPEKDVSFNENYWIPMNDHTPLSSRNYSWRYLSTEGRPGVVQNCTTSNLAVRPATFLDLSTVVFGISAGSGNSFANVSSQNIPSTYTSLWNETVDKPHMKLRIEDSTLTSTTNLIEIQNRYGNGITKSSLTSHVYLNATAQAGSGIEGTNTVSVLLFNNDGKFLYYKPLEDAKGSGSYELDLSGLPKGKYNIGIVNEVYNENSTAPANSSKISNVLPLEIVDPLTFSVTPRTGFVYNNNVNHGDTVATYTTSNGVSPITVTVVSDTSVSGHANDDQLFSVSSGNIVVDDPNGLDAGDYYFKVNAIDDNGDPVNGITSSTIHITVAKANTTIAFNDPGMTKKSISSAGTSWNETATANPTNGTKITYTKVGGDIGMIHIDPDTGAITYNGGNAFGKVKIRATVDDDPSTGNDNYNPAFVEKEIVIYREVNGVITPDPAFSDTTIPTFAASDANVRTGGTIGKIQGTLGTPDTIGGSITTYAYAIKPGGDGSMFQVNTSNGTIKSNANLGVGTYNFIIIVSDRWSSKEIPVTVNVGMAPAENLKFYQSPTSNTIITTKSATLTDMGVSVYATVKGSSNTNPVTYRIQDGSTNVITVHPNSGAITINGVGSVVIVAEKTGNTGQANAVTQLTFTVTAGSQTFIYTDASGNELPKSGNDYDDYSEVYGQGKTFQLYTTGNPPGTTVTYALKSSSPTDVLSVDLNGLVSIYNASLNTQIGQVIVEATSHDPNGNYTDKTIELPINITKANQAISFSGVTSAQNGRGTVTPVIVEQDISSNDGGVTVNDTNYYISVNPSASGIAWTNNGIDIEYDYSGTTAIEILLEVTKAGNRNYNSVTATGKMKILSPSESTLSINQPGRIYYGDHFTLRSLQDDSLSANVNYTFTVDNTIFVSNPTVNGNMAEFDALKCSNGTKINITVTRTADSEVTLSKKITIEVLPKDINVIIDDKTKQKGDPNPMPLN